jgi:hypothetical protein
MPSLALNKSKYQHIFVLAYTILFIYVISSFFFNLLVNHDGSDIENYINQIEWASEGYYLNRSDGFFDFIRLESFYYLVLSKLGVWIEAPLLLLQLISVSLVVLFVYPIALEVASSPRRLLLFSTVTVIILHPRFLDLLMGNLQSGIALAVLFHAIQIKNKTLKYTLLLIAPLLHLGVMIPVIYYMLYIVLVHSFKKILPKYVFSIAILLVSLIMVLIAKELHPQRGIGDWEGGALYTFIIVIIAIYSFYFRKYFIRSAYGFLSIGLILTVVWGSIMGYSTMRYFSFYLPFLAMGIASTSGIHRQTSLLFLVLMFFLLFTIVSHSYWLLAIS